jgi:26S proteasome regulatory subunit N6
VQIEVCKDQIEWARSEKRSFLRQRIEMRLAALMMETGEFHPALQLVGTLLTEVKRLDDKLLLVDVHLIESRLHHHLLNTPKSKAALTAARSAANSVYVPPSLQVCSLLLRVAKGSRQKEDPRICALSSVLMFMISLG